MSDDMLQQASGDRNRLGSIRLDEASIARGNASLDHEREVAIFDLLDGNSFAVIGHDTGPYDLELAIADERLLFRISDATGEVVTHTVPMQPLRRIMKDYFIVLDSYYQAVRTASASRIEAIDVGRRGLHDEGSTLLRDKLATKFDIDFDTARRLFTLISALHWKG